jgi:hypothetical protein
MSNLTIFLVEKDLELFGLMRFEGFVDGVDCVLLSSTITFYEQLLCQYTRAGVPKLFRCADHLE